MQKSVARLKSFWRDESGTTAIEYALIGTLIAVALFGTFGVLGDGVAGLFTTASNVATESLSNASSLL